MDVWVVSIDGVVQGDCFTSKRGACRFAGVSYQMAMRGKLIFNKRGSVIVLSCCSVIRMSDKVKNFGRSGKKGF